MISLIPSSEANVTLNGLLLQVQAEPSAVPQVTCITVPSETLTVATPLTPTSKPLAAPDRTPIIGFDARAEGFFWLAGQGGYGIQTAPAASLLAAALIRGKAVPAPRHGPLLQP